VGVFRWRPLAEARPLELGLLKLAAGAGLLCAFYYDQRLAVTGSLLFLWLLIVDVPPVSGPAYSNRLLVAFLCPLFSLQLFPMAGEQVDWGALMPMMVSAVLLADGANCVAREGVRQRLPWLTAFAGTPEILLTVLLFALVGRNALGDLKQWRSLPRLNLPGTHWLRLAPEATAQMTMTVRAINQNCQAVLLVPGLYSFSLWSGVPPAEEKRINNWPFLWPDAVRNNELRKLRHEVRGCVLVRQDVYDFFKNLAVSPPAEGLLQEIQWTMRPVYMDKDVILYRFLP
jgi:hypothetical protein